MTCIPNKFHIVEEKVPVLLTFLMSAMCFIKVLYIIETPIFFLPWIKKLCFLTGFAIFDAVPEFLPK